MKFDQHFLFDDEILDKIIKVINISNKDLVLEIASGRGDLTKKILNKNPKKIYGVEIDENLFSYLNNLKNQNKNFDFSIENGLEFLQNSKLNFNKICSNLPYSITEAFFKILMRTNFELGVFVLGKNFFNYVIENENSKLHYFINSHFEVDEIFEISGDKFTPKTKVKSVCILIKPKKTKTEFEKFLLLWFLKYNRNVKNSLIFSFVDFFNISKKESFEKFNELNINEKFHSKKVDYLSNRQFIYLIKKLEKLF